MPVQIEFKIDPSIAKRIEQLGERAVEGLSIGLKYAAFELRKAVQELIRNSPRGGRSYKVGKGRFHKSSAPGQAPARDTGNLMNRITARQKDAVTAVVEAATAYSGYLEKGTSKMKARPFLLPALEQNLDVIDRIIAEEVDKATR